MQVVLALVLGLGAVPAPAGAQIAVGVKNFQQLASSYAELTGVDEGDPDIDAYFQRSKTRLPKVGRADEVSSPMLLTAAALGGLYCEKMIANDAALPAAQRRAHKQVDFAKGPADALTVPVRASVVAEYARLFWRRAATDVEAALLLSLFAPAGASAAPDATQTALRPVCTAVAASLATLVN